MLARSPRAGVDTFTFLLVHFLGVRYLEALITALIGTMSACFLINWAQSGAAGELKAPSPEGQSAPERRCCHHRALGARRLTTLQQS